MMIQLLRRKGTADTELVIVGTDGKVQHQGNVEFLLLDSPNHGPEYSHLRTYYVEEAEHRKAGVPPLQAQVMT